MSAKSRRMSFDDGSFVDDESTNGPEWVSNHGSERYRITNAFSVLVMENGNTWGLIRKGPKRTLHIYAVEDR